VNKGDFGFRSVVFPVGIAIAKAAWVNHGHAPLHAIRRSRVWAEIELRRETGRKIGPDRRSSKT
jgi:hypothetical protein